MLLASIKSTPTVLNSLSPVMLSVALNGACQLRLQFEKIEVIWENWDGTG